jgi:hydroxymethylpyrimidine pyrophosphatase-like HAD family hydrolase
MKLLLVSESYLDKEIEEIQSIISSDETFLNEYYKDLNEHAINKVINYAEFGCANDTKATGIIELANMLGISLSEIMAIGD